jgi:phage tail sheath gpL-like
MSSDAVGSERIAKIVGYKLAKGNFAESSPNLPQRIAVIGEANTANQGSLDLEPFECTSAQQAGERYGFGSPIFLQMRILRPTSGGGAGGIPTIVYPQAEPAGAAEKVIQVSPTGTVNANGTHTVVIGGRYSLDGGSYDINLVSGDTSNEITQKIENAINNVLGCPVTASSTDYEAVLTSKWKGLTADGITLSIDTNGNDLGITYSITSLQSGSGTPTVTSSLEKFQNQWNTIVSNGYGMNASVITELEQFNGIPQTIPTGRYAGIVFKPFIAVCGSVADNNSSFTDTKKLQVTVAVAPAPLSMGLPLEASANMTVIFARVSQDTPHLDVSGLYYPDMPTPVTIGTMSSYDNRDAYVKKGNSCVELLAGQYRVTDFITTYHPDGEVPPQYRYCRNLMIDYNVRYGYYLLEQINVVDHAIAADEDTVIVNTVVKPKTWKGVLNKYFVDLSRRGIIVQPDFSSNSLRVSISTTNPDRLETTFDYKRSGFTRIASTTASAGFNFGTL